MTNGAANPTFLDTNVLVYASIAQAPFHTVALNTIQTLEESGVELWISRQVLREYLAVLSRPQTFTSPIATSTLIAQVQAFESRFKVAEDKRPWRNCLWKPLSTNGQRTPALARRRKCKRIKMARYSFIRSLFVDAFASN